MIQKLALAYGIIFVIVGVAGAARGAYGGEHVMLAGIFHVDAVHNTVHLLSGLAAIIAAKSAQWAQWYFRIFGVIYSLLAVVGLLQRDTILGLTTINMADNLLHIALGGIGLAIGFLLPQKDKQLSV